MLFQAACAAFVGVFYVCLLQVADPVQSQPVASQPAQAGGAATWLAKQKTAVSATEFVLLSRAQATLLANIGDPNDAYAEPTVGGRKSTEAGKPLPWAPLRGTYPSPFKYRGVWNWDGAFHALAIARWDPALAREQLEILLRFQQPNGMLPDVIMEDGTVVTEFGKPPVAPWVCMRMDQLAPDRAFLRAVYPKFVKYEEYWMKERGGTADGLFHYGGTNPAFESGWDSSVRWDKGCENLWTVDLNCYMVMVYESMGYMARELMMEGDRWRWQQRARELGQRINETLWNDAAGAYMDRDRRTRAFSGVLSPASFMPLYVNIASRAKAERMAKLAGDPQKFFPGMPSVSYDHPEYRSHDYWRGPTWVNIAYFAWRGLKEYGFDRVADDGRRTILQWCERNKDSLWEYYDSKSGAGLGAKQYGWTGTFVIEFILNWSPPPSAAKR